MLQYRERRISAMASMTTQAESPANPQPLHMSYEEYQAWAEGVHAEWKDGEVITFMPPKKYHQRVVELLHTLVDLFVQVLQLGRVGIAPFEVKLGPGGPSREPDLFFAGISSLDRWTDDRFEGGPDLVVEVISKDSVGRDRGDKFYEYQTAGVREYWIIDPRPGYERADFYSLDEHGRYQPLLPDHDGIVRSQVLPGFVFRLEWLWQEPAPAALALLRELAHHNPALAEALRATLG
jgi:Uma2 family endonuclease